jgi:hypothetical protein
MGTYHHAMARHCVLDGGTVSSMEGSCKYIELVVTDSRQGIALQLRVWVRCKKILTVKTIYITKYKLVPQTWINPLIWAEDRDRRRALVNAVMKFLFP